MNPAPKRSERATAKSPRRQLRAKLLLLLITLLFCVAVIEIGLRIAGFSYAEFYAFDERRGYALSPGVEGWYRKEGEAYIRINSDGLRDREHTKIKPPNTLRVAVLGDSFTEALQVPFESSFCAVLERKLRECQASGGRDIEVINFGVSGYSTAQELITLREHVWQYSPDMVLLAFTTANDVSDNVRELKRVDRIPYFVWRDGSLVEDQSYRGLIGFKLRRSFLGSLGRWLRDHLRVVQGIDLAARNYKTMRAVRQETPRAQSSPGNQSGTSSGTPVATHSPELSPTGDFGIDNQIYREPADQVWNNAWRTTEGLIKLMSEDVRARGAKFLVLTLSSGIQVAPNSQTREAFLKTIGARDIFYPDNRIREYCEREGIPVVTLAPLLQQYAESNNSFLHGFGENIGNGHWNAAGNYLAAELTAPRTCVLLSNP